MCIAIVKPMGIKAPSKRILKECWENNPNGAGYCYNNGKQVVIHKGFMTFNEFYKSFKQLDYTDCDLIIHFRIATHGGINKECTHPFVVSKNISEMQKLDTTCKRAFVHNGIISGFGSRNDKDKISDTMDYCSKIIANIPQINHELLDNLANDKNSRFAVLTKNNYTIGGNWLKDNDIYYSNSTYKPKEKPVQTTVYRTYDYWRNWYDKYYKDSRTCFCEFCGMPTSNPKTVNYYGDLFEVCGDCYNAINERQKNYAEEEIKIYD